MYLDENEIIELIKDDIRDIFNKNIGVTKEERIAETKRILDEIIKYNTNIRVTNVNHDTGEISMEYTTGVKINLELEE